MEVIFKKKLNKYFYSICLRSEGLGKKAFIPQFYSLFKQTTYFEYLDIDWKNIIFDL